MSSHGMTLTCIECKAETTFPAHQSRALLVRLKQTGTAYWTCRARHPVEVEGMKTFRRCDTRQIATGLDAGPRATNTDEPAPLVSGTDSTAITTTTSQSVTWSSIAPQSVTDSSAASTGLPSVSQQLTPATTKGGNDCKRCIAAIEATAQLCAAHR